MAIRNIDCLNEHLARLMDMKQLFIYSKRMNFAEYELGNFLNSRISSLQDHATSKQVKLEIRTEFKYASVWIDKSKISPVIEKFIKNAIDHSEASKTLL